MTQSEGGFSWLLRNEPSVRLWSIELGSIADGSREGAISNFGGPSGYVKSILFNSREPSVAEYCFDEAFRRLVERWHPIATPNAHLDLRMLQLLGAFTPSEGIGKVIGLLKNFNLLERAGQDERVQSLKPVVLQVLEQYFAFEQPPLGAFEEYVVQLESNLAFPDYAAYAVARLRELRRLNARDARLGELIRRDPLMLREFLEVFLPSIDRDSRDLEYVSEIYWHCLHSTEDLRALAEFERTVRNAGLTFERANSGPYISKAERGWREAIQIDGADLDIYYVRVHFQLAGEDIQEKIKEIDRESEVEAEAFPYELDLVEELVL